MFCDAVRKYDHGSRATLLKGTRRSVRSPQRGDMKSLFGKSLTYKYLRTHIFEILHSTTQFHVVQTQTMTVSYLRHHDGSHRDASVQLWNKLRMKLFSIQTKNKFQCNSPTIINCVLSAKRSQLMTRILIFFFASLGIKQITRNERITERPLADVDDEEESASESIRN